MKGKSKGISVHQHEPQKLGQRKGSNAFSRIEYINVGGMENHNGYDRNGQSQCVFGSR